MNEMNLQLFGAQTVMNGTAAYVNGDNGTSTPYSGANSLSPTMKTYYDSELLENARSEQFGKKQPLPANKGRTVEWRKLNTLPTANALQEGVVPTGEKLGMSSLTGSLTQYGMFVAITDLLDMHAVDNILLGATEELGASAGETRDRLIRNELMTGTNVMFCDAVSDTGAVTAVSGYAGMKADNNRLTPDMVNKAATWLKKCKAPRIGGKYIAVIHPSVAYDLRASSEWIEAHKYAANTEIFTGEIGELHGVRFIESTNAKVTQKDVSGGKAMVYSTLFFGKNAYGIIDPEGGSMEMIVKDRSEVGGPLEQYSTAGYKFEDCTRILYPERLLRVESCSAYSAVDAEN